MTATGCDQIAALPSESDEATGTVEEALIVTAAQTGRVPMNADTAVRSYLANTPGGTSRDLLVGRSVFDWTRSMVRVDTQAIRNMMGDQGQFLAAKLILTITASIDGSLNGTEVGAHRMTKAWTEPGATWNCSIDTSPTNLWKNCSTADSWTMGGGAGTGPYVAAPTGTGKVTTGLSGILELDVTADVKAFLDGTSANNGWLLRVQNDPIASLIYLSSREGPSPPQLSITFVGPCNPATTACGTEVQWEAPDGDELPILEDPLPSDQTAAMADAFDWANTEAVPELTPEGHPTLRYANIYVESQNQAANLDGYEIDHSMLPFFREERTKWRGKKGDFEFTGDGRGVFVFAILPGKIYNMLRQYAIDHPNEQPYRAIILRAPPTSAPTYADGSLQYRWLAEQGYLYRGVGADQGTGLAGVSQGLGVLGWIRETIVEPIANTARKVVDGVREGIGGIGRIIKGAAALNLSVYANVADPAFKSKALMRRGWGANRGKPIPVHGVEVRVTQGIINAQLATKWTDDNGFARILVTRDSEADICVRLKSSHALMTTFLFPMESCQFTISAGDVNGEVSERIHISSRYMQGFVQAIDSADYLHDVSNYDPYPVRILTGRIAKWLTGVQKNGGGAFTPCADFANWKYDSLQAIMDVVLSHVITAPPLDDTEGDLLISYKQRLAAAGALAAGFVSPDIVIHKDSLKSRGVMTHEYGHFAMCSLLYDEGADVFADAYTEVITDALIGEGKSVDEARVVAEAWADFFASQVAGGVNYFPLYGDKASHNLPSVSRGMSYCSPYERQCMDNNYGGRQDYDATKQPFAERQPDVAMTDFKAAIAQITTTIHDVFDGNPQSGVANVPGNGAAWYNDKPIDGDRTEIQSYPFTFASSLGHQGDENVAMPMDLVDLFHRWATVDFNTKHRLRKKSIDVALAEYMRARGINDTQICELFALHQSNSVCPRHIPVARNETPAPAALSGFLFRFGTAKPPIPPPVIVDLKGRNARWEWTADAPYADFFDYTVKDGSTVIAGSSLQYRRDQVLRVDQQNVAFNRELEMTVTIVNGSLRSKPVSHVIATPAEPVTIVSAVPQTDRVQVCWNETQATSYAVEYRSVGDWTLAGVVDDGTSASSCFSLRGLPPSVFEARITARNRHGVAADASPVVSFTPLTPKEIFVSSVRGNDATADGTMALPFRTIGAALTFLSGKRALTTQVPVCDQNGCSTQTLRSVEYDYSAVRMTAGSYASSAFAFDGSDFTTVLTGGLAEGTWSPTPGTVSSIRATLGAGVALGCPGGESGTALPSAVSVKGGSLLIERIDLSASPLTGEFSFCQAVIGARRTTGLQIIDSVVSFAGSGGAGACQIGVAVDGGSGGSSDAVTITRSSIVATSLNTSQNLSGTFLGMCSGAVPSVRVDRSQISATNAPQLAAATGSGILWGAGFAAQSVDVTRSFVGAINNRHEWRNDASQLGLQASAKYIRIDNSVMRTATGGATNTAMKLIPIAGGDVRIAQVTAITGANWAQTVAGPSDQKGAAVFVLAGATKRMVMVNSLFAYAAGTHIDKTGIDRSLVTANPASALIAGNIFSVYDPRIEGGISLASPLRCKQGPGAYADHWTLNEPTFHGCAGTLGDPRAYDVWDNRWLSMAPCSSYPASSSSGDITQAICTANISGAGSSFNNATTEHRFDGEPVPFRDGRIGCSGIKLPPEFEENGRIFAIRDFSGTTRRQQRPRALCHIPKPGAVIDEISNRNSVGAFDGDCTCDALDPLIF